MEHHLFPRLSDQQCLRVKPVVSRFLRERCMTGRSSSLLVVCCSAHVEHHLFPRLSDQQCLRVKPVVSRFLRARGMAYNEAAYTERLALFLTRYRQLMVHAPPVSHFVGLQ